MGRTQQGLLDETNIPFWCAHHLAGDFSLVGRGAKRVSVDPWCSAKLGAEQVSPHIFLGQAPPSCQAANSSELLPNMNAAGVRGRWQQILLQASGPLGPRLTPARCLLSGSKVSTPGWGDRIQPHPSTQSVPQRAIPSPTLKRIGWALALKDPVLTLEMLPFVVCPLCGPGCTFSNSSL